MILYCIICIEREINNEGNTYTKFIANKSIKLIKNKLNRDMEKLEDE